MSDERITADVVVVGSGAGGALTAATLAEAGLDVVVLEEGPWLEADATEPFSKAEMTAKYRDRGISVSLGQPPVAYVEGRCVGGSTEINSGLYHRTPPELVSEWRRDYDIDDFDVDDLAVHYEGVEKALTVSQLPGPAPAHSSMLDTGGGRLGWDVVQVPRWMAYPEGETSFRSGVKQTMTRTFIPRSTAAGARIIAGCRATKVLRRGSRAIGVACVRDDGRRLVVDADHVFVCAGPIHTPALLQRSGVRGVGRGLKMHVTIKVVARFADEVPGSDAVPVHQVKEFAPDLTLGTAISLPGHIAMTLADDWATNGADMDDWRRMAVYYAAIRTQGAGRVIAVPGIKSPFVTYQVTDRDLSHLARGALALGELLFAAGAQRLYPSIADTPPIDRPDDLVRLWGATTRGRASLMTIHLFSSVRMGERRDRTGTNSFGQVWGFDNLYVNDASLIPDAPGVNPQGTVMAIAARNCQRFLADR
ncbi:MAG TPA: FAD-dependent oxidoreductase [Acidimicrobiales bacterium]|nr:FAD-dependent oxidoreductase [Acidimicrobiales bacterium]